MVDILNNIGIENAFTDVYSSFLNSMPEHYQLLFNIFLFTILIALYSIFVFQFYKFLARKNIIKLNLSQYNTSEHPFLSKFLAVILFLLEYIIILPILVFSWFAILSFLLLLLSRDQPIEQILLVSAAVVGAIRVTSYFKEDLSKDLAKVFPFTVLIIFLLSPNPLEFVSVLGKISQLPLFINNIFYYLVFIICFEIFIRFIYTITYLFKHPEEQEKEEIKEALKDEEG